MEKISNFKILKVMKFTSNTRFSHYILNITSILWFFRHFQYHDLIDLSGIKL